MTLSATDKKPIWTSQTAWGAVAAICAGLSTAVYSYYAGDPGTALASLVGAFGGLTALVGRIKATSQIGQAAVTVVELADEALVGYAASKGITVPPADTNSQDHPGS